MVWLIGVLYLVTFLLFYDRYREVINALSEDIYRCVIWNKEAEDLGEGVINAYNKINKFYELMAWLYIPLIFTSVFIIVVSRFKN